jgi:hypothetical protein
MKKRLLLLVMIGFTITAATKAIHFNEKQNKSTFSNNADYKECIKDCNACILACTNCYKACAKMKDPKMNKCIRLCQETIATCNASIKLMQLNSENAKEQCLICAKVCEKCATECEKFDMKECKDCSMSCKKTANSCRALMK